MLLLFLLSLIVEEFETTQINQNYKSIDSITKTTHHTKEKQKKLLNLQGKKLKLSIQDTF